MRKPLQKIRLIRHRQKILRRTPKQQSPLKKRKPLQKRLPIRNRQKRLQRNLLKIRLKLLIRK